MLPSPGEHIPVLLSEVIEILAPRPGDVILDCTAGLGGHAAAMAERLLVSPQPLDGSPSAATPGTLVLVDADAGNLARATQRVRSVVAGVSAAIASGSAGQLPPSAIRIEPLHGTFASAPRRLRELGLRANVVLADLGFCSNQIEDATRGFSFQRDGPLDMRLNRSDAGEAPVQGSSAAGASPSGPSAAELVNTLPERELADILREFGEEPAARSIAAKIARERQREPIKTTRQLVEVVHSVVVRKHGSGIDPATRTFQALRIAVNDELGALQAMLDQIETAAVSLAGHANRGEGESGGSGGASTPPGWLASGARIGIITFHSLEDRPVKQSFASLIERGVATGISPHRSKPVVASEQEIQTNPRSRSAKLRAIRLLS